MEWNEKMDEDKHLTNPHMVETHEISRVGPDDPTPISPAMDGARTIAQPSAGIYHTTSLGGGLTQCHYQSHDIYRLIFAITLMVNRKHYRNYRGKLKGF